MEYVVDKKWKWVECNLVIKRLPQKNNHEGVYESLEAEVELMSDEADIRNFESEVTMEKSFEFEEGRGFIWHKSWYIPEIVLKLSPKVTKMLKEENQMKKVYCEMLSGYPFKKDEHFYLEEVKLEGDNLREFNKKGEVSFSNIKFSETSFNKNKNKFSIILVLYTSFKQNEKNIIKSYISSPIHVDSRKEARKKISANTFIQDEININKFLNKLEGAEKLVTPTNPYEELLTIPGFIKYYTAANIRFKIKHPYYIGYHFHDVFDVYYNSEEAKDPVDVLDIIYENELKENEKVKPKPKEKKDIYTDNKEILKKSSPKILLFLIKNAPKECLLIKDELPISDEKIQIQPLNESEALEKEKSQKNGDNYENTERIVEKTYELARFQQLNETEKERIDENGQNLIKNCLVHIIQPPSNNPLISSHDKNLEEDEEKEMEDMENNETSKLVKEEENSEFGIEFLLKNGEKEGTELSKKEQKKLELLREEEAIKKIYSIFDSWKFNFVYLKKSDGGLTVINKKWVYIPSEELLESFKIYTNKKPFTSIENNRLLNEEGAIGQNQSTNVNSYQTYDIHQVIVLQKGKSNKVKIEEDVPNRDT